MVPRDVPSLEVLRRQAVEAGFSEVYDRSDFADVVAGEEDAFPRWIDDDRFEAVVAETDVTVVGFGVLDRERCRVAALYTAPAHQGHGCGSRMLTHLEDAAREAGCTRLVVEAPRNADGFFADRGYEAVGDTTRWGLPMTERAKDLGTTDG